MIKRFFALSLEPQVSVALPWSRANLKSEMVAAQKQAARDVFLQHPVTDTLDLHEKDYCIRRWSIVQPQTNRATVVSAEVWFDGTALADDDLVFYMMKYNLREVDIFAAREHLPT